ncbi:MAG: hypothetical protein QOG62_1723 [Thermoleophilaceae bacterium]|nr:hypothetical protein [Thermoleophilaceae bacterium]
MRGAAPTIRGVRALIIVIAALVAVAVWVPPARAAERPPTDPRPGSPSEAIYGIQVDRARRDAAPGGRSGQASRSELGVGTSAIVPGTAREGVLGGPGPAPEGGDRSGVAVGLMLILLTAVALGSGAVAARAIRRSSGG